MGGGSCRSVMVIVLAVVLAVMFLPGCTQNSENNSEYLSEKNIRYNFTKYRSLIYEIASYNQIDNSSSIEIRILNISDNVATMRLKLGGVDNSSYIMTVTDRGEILNSSQIPIQTQIILPIVIYPEEPTETWSEIVNKSGSFVSGGNSFNYVLTGQENYTFLGWKTISCADGLFSCIEISKTAMYVINMSVETSSGTIYTTSFVNLSGRYWADSRSGFIVKSKCRVDEILKVNYTDIYRAFGLEGVYGEVPLISEFEYKLVKN
jgi:hypothetical protein